MNPKRQCHQSFDDNYALAAAGRGLRWGKVHGLAQMI